MGADLQLLQAYAVSRDAEAFSTILRRHRDLVYGTCLRILGNTADAEDAAQESFLKLARNAGSVHSSVVGWLHRCATHVALTAIQQARARARREEAYGETRVADRREATWAEIGPEVDQALEELPEEYRLVLAERYLRQRPQAEIAQELGISRATLHRRLTAGIEMLRRRLRQAGVLASVVGLAAALKQNAVVAAPARLACELGKLALAGLGRPMAAVPAGSSVLVSAGTVTAASAAKAAAVVVVTAALAVGLGLAVSWCSGSESEAAVALAADPVDVRPDAPVHLAGAVAAVAGREMRMPDLAPPTGLRARKGVAASPGGGASARWRPGLSDGAIGSAGCGLPPAAPVAGPPRKDTEPEPEPKRKARRAAGGGSAGGAGTRRLVRPREARAHYAPPKAGARVRPADPLGQTYRSMGGVTLYVRNRLQ